MRRGIVLGNHGSQILHPAPLCQLFRKPHHKHAAVRRVALLRTSRLLQPRECGVLGCSGLSIGSDVVKHWPESLGHFKGNCLVQWRVRIQVYQPCSVSTDAAKACYKTPVRSPWLVTVRVVIHREQYQILLWKPQMANARTEIV